MVAAWTCGDQFRRLAQEVLISLAAAETARVVNGILEAREELAEFEANDKRVPLSHEA